MLISILMCVVLKAKQFVDYDPEFVHVHTSTAKEV